MKRNERLLQEAFFKKESYAEKLRKKLPQYEPQDRKILGQPGFDTILSRKDTAFGQQLGVSDIGEAKKRLIGGFGASIGVNTVKNIASRSIKSFPIVISDHIDAETSVMLKRLMEEQYAEYINLMVSNQVIDISNFRSSEEGNIAIQALDTLSGADFGKQALAKKALKGELSPEDLFGSFSSFNLIRNEEKEYKTGDPATDYLLENAYILPKEESEKLIEFIQLFPEELHMLNELSSSEHDPRGANPTDRNRFVNLTSFLSNKEQGNFEDFNKLRGFEKSTIGTLPEEKEERLKKIEKDLDDYRKILDKLDRKINKTAAEINQADLIRNTIIRDLNAEIVSLKNERDANPVKTGAFNRLTSTDIVVDRHQLKNSLDSSVAELLLNPKNEALKDRFEKATFLLQSQRIAGSEYIEYLVQRLGIPLSKETRQHLVSAFKIKDVVNPEDSSLTISSDDIDRIKRNQVVVGEVLKPLVSVLAKHLLIATTVMGGIAGGIYAITKAGAIIALLSGPLGPFIIGAAVGGTALAAYYVNFFKKRMEIIKSRKGQKIFGWERVEMLIENLNEQRRNLKKTYERDRDLETDLQHSILLKDLPFFKGKELEAEFEKYSKGIDKILRDTKPAKTNPLVDSALIADFSQETLLEFSELGNSFFEELSNDQDYKISLAEAKVQTTIPVQLIKQYEYDTSAKPEIMVAPLFSSRSSLAYGSVEYDKRELKDRKYNTPLIMKITFKERFADGDSADNELVAVIGILGVITRVPSEEMKYILQSNTEGITIKDILKPDGNSTNLISDILGLTKLKKNIENLKYSADVWENLERVARISLANKLAGKASGNIANTHLVFSQKEIDEVRTETGKDYLKDKKLSADLMKRYSAFTVMIANDISERLFIYDDPDSISWSVVPYGAIRNKDTGDQLTSALMSISRGRM